jgi:hypothetical protein
MTEHGADKSTLAASWERFCVGLAQAGREALAVVDDERDAAEGLEQLGILLEVALRWYLRGADPDHPRFIEINDTPEVADNLFAAVRGDAVYRLSGDISTLFDINISIHKGWAWLSQVTQPTGDIGRADLEVDKDGRFELILGGEKRPGNWLPLPPDAEFIQLREYHADFSSHRPGQFEIVRLGAENDPPHRPTPAEIVERLDQALAWATRYGSFHRASLGKTYPDTPNTMRPPANFAGGNSHIWYGFGRVALGPDETLLLSFDKPRARLWSVQWLTDPWYENPDMVNRFSGITSAEAYVNADGRVRIVFAPQDPGVPNWLETTDYPRGLFVTRWIWCDESCPTETVVVPRATLRDHLPADTPVVTAETRAAQRARRRTHFVHRRR